MTGTEIASVPRGLCTRLDRLSVATLGVEEDRARPGVDRTILELGHVPEVLGQGEEGTSLLDPPLVDQDLEHPAQDARELVFVRS